MKGSRFFSIKASRYLTSAAFLAFLTACNAGGNNTNIEWIQNMMDQVSIKSQDWNPAEGDKVQMRMPPPGTVARGHAPYKYANDSVAAEKQPNPLAGNNDPATLEKGRKYYDIYCLVCHGDKGAGDGPVAEKMAVKPRNLLLPEAKAYTDGRIYHAIVAGRGVMGSYAGQIPDDNTRWAIVNYLRTLQR
jgi:mono/diheme cytochrome c family protein